MKRFKREQFKLPFDGNALAPQPVPVLDPERSRAVVDAMVRRVEERARRAYLDMLVDAIHALALHLSTLASDDVWVHVGAERMAQGNPSALGAAFRIAARLGYIRLQPERKDSQRPSMHRKPLRIWESRICRGAAA